MSSADRIDIRLLNYFHSLVEELMGCPNTNTQQVGVKENEDGSFWVLLSAEQVRVITSLKEQLYDHKA